MMYNGFVYLAKSDTGHYKIGRSKNPYGRIKHFDTIMPVNVKIVHYFPCDNPRQAEAEMHQIADRHAERVAGEWFSLSQFIVSIFCTIRFFINGEFNQPVFAAPIGKASVYPCCKDVLDEAIRTVVAYELDDQWIRVKGEPFDIDKELKDLMSDEESK